MLNLLQQAASSSPWVLSMQWWHWLVIGLFLCLSELVVPAFVLVWLGLAALLLGLLLLLVPLSLTAQLLVWIVLSTALVFLWLRIFRDKDQSMRIGISDAAIGEVGLLVRDVMPFAPGEILFQRPLMGSDRWMCIADAKLNAGSRARVVRVEGNALKVESEFKPFREPDSASAVVRTES
ncbi:NfeD family protein [Uliginosibacterium sp. 31-16]|uniref:NfeD family protein n=1 Tax=Uliginosibacterium sp. 31-16 TaxID=3068315 RepID=UPI00273D53D3|nr:NfeD family protein [Uliginosibacterium sp. 31-16]MDP5239462.1 NfeD family protein [Uliginosibacterium sp. 31-16]